MKRPALPTSSVQDFVDVITGKDFAGKKFNSALAYGEVKYMAALWMSAQARKHPELRLLTASPGNTQGTETASAMPTPVRILTQRIIMPIIAPLLGLAHSVETGAGRIVAGLTKPSFQSGVFYASAEKKLTGPVNRPKPNLSRLGQLDLSAKRRRSHPQVHLSSLCQRRPVSHLYSDVSTG